jgi:hypothetical protein
MAIHIFSRLWCSGKLRSRTGLTLFHIKIKWSSSLFAPSQKHILWIEGISAPLDFFLGNCKANAILILCRHIFVTGCKLLSKIEEIALLTDFTRW